MYVATGLRGHRAEQRPFRTDVDSDRGRRTTQRNVYMDRHNVYYQRVEYHCRTARESYILPGVTTTQTPTEPTHKRGDDGESEFGPLRSLLDNAKP